MGMSLRNLGETAADLAEALVEGEPGATAPMPAPKLDTAQGRKGYDRAIDAMNRLPRPATALGTLALVGFALVDPAGFEARMQALAAMPDQLWWIVGGVLTFTFGAREAFYMRATRGGSSAEDRR